MFGAFEQNWVSKSRVMKRLSWETIDDAIAYFQANGAHVERDLDGFEAADVMTKGGVVMAIERIA